MTPAAPRIANPTRAVFFALVAVTILKLVWAATSGGSIDVVLFYNYAKSIDKLGLLGLYPVTPKFNHTPLTATFIQFLYRGAGGDYNLFAFFFRFATTLADAAVVIGLIRFREALGHRPPWWGLLLFALSPVSIMVSGFHGNVDPLMVAALFFAMVAAVKERPVLCGLLFGLACNVKVIPLFLGPVFFFYWMARGRPWRFAFSCAAVLLLGSIFALLVCPRDYLRNVYAYGGYWGVWGVPYWLRLSGWAEVQKVDFFDLTALQQRIVSVFKFTAVAAVLALGWRRRQAKPAEFPATLGLAWIVFFLLAPGVGVQYMVWFAPFLLLLDVRSYAVVTAAATVMLVVFYQSCSEGGRFPWFLSIPLGPELPYWTAVGTVVWATFGYAFYRTFGQIREVTGGANPALADSAELRDSSATV